MYPATAPQPRRPRCAPQASQCVGCLWLRRLPAALLFSADLHRALLLYSLHTCTLSRRFVGTGARGVAGGERAVGNRGQRDARARARARARNGNKSCYEDTVTCLLTRRLRAGGERTVFYGNLYTPPTVASLCTICNITRGEGVGICVGGTGFGQKNKCTQ